MREPDLHVDGWCLENGETRHAEAPATFQIPHLQIRRILQPGDFAKLIFSIAVQGQDQPAGERMWVIVRERTADGYLGILDNEPSSVAKNDEFWRGIELPFEPRHIIDVQHGTESSVAISRGIPARRWA